MTAADIDALEKSSRSDATVVQRYKNLLLGELADSPEKIVRWHVAQLLPRLRLKDAADRRRRVAILERWFDRDPSTIVRVNALQALSELAAAEPRLRTTFERRLRAALADEQAAVRARARKLADV